MGVKGKGASGIIVEWTLRDKDGNIKDSGLLEEERQNGYISK